MKTLVIALTMLLWVFVLGYFVPVQAATEDVPPCAAINALPDGSITVYRCEPNEGNSYLVNSLGFMLVED